MKTFRVYRDGCVYVRYRLLAEPPFTVVFPSVTFTVRWSHDGYGRHWLNAERRGGLWCLFEHTDGSRRHVHPIIGTPPCICDDRIPWVTGIDINRHSGSDTILQRIVRDGRAEIVIGPHSQVRVYEVFGPC